MPGGFLSEAVSAGGEIGGCCERHDYHFLHSNRRPAIHNKMPTLLVKFGLKFFFYANEHEPKHIHVAKGGDFAKIELANLKVVKNFLKPSDLKKALVLIREHRLEFERRWNEYFKG